MCRYDGIEVIVVFVGWIWESRFDDGAGYGNGVIFLEVQFAGDGGGDGWRDIEPFICLVNLAINGDCV